MFCTTGGELAVVRKFPHAGATTLFAAAGLEKSKARNPIFNRAFNDTYN